MNLHWVEASIRLFIHEIHKHFLCTCYGPDTFLSALQYINWSTCHYKPMKKALTLCPFQRWGNWDTWKLSNLTKHTAKIGIHILAVCLQNSCSLVLCIARCQEATENVATNHVSWGGRGHQGVQHRAKDVWFLKLQFNPCEPLVNKYWVIWKENALKK